MAVDGNRGGDGGKAERIERGESFEEIGGGV